MGTPLSGYSRRFVGATGEPGIQGAQGTAGADTLSGLTISQKTANYTLRLTDANTTLIEMNVASANTVTIPPNSSVDFAIGDVILVSQYGAGSTSIVAGAGVTLRSSLSRTTLTTQYSVCTLTKRAENEWYLSGDLQ